ASLLLKTLYRLRVLDPGFDVERVLTMRVALPEVHYPEDHDADDFFRELQERIETLPGVLSAGFTTAIPISDWAPNMGVQRDSAPIVPGSATSSNAQFQWVSRDYHRVVGQQLEKGRLFDEGDHTESPPVAIINKRMAREFWGGEDPIGESFRFVGSSARIVGVVSDVKRFGLDKDAPREVYVPLAQAPGERVRSVVVRSAVDPTLIADDLRRVIAALDSRLPVYNLQAMAAVLSDSISGTRFVTLLLSLFAGAATLLAAVGVYSVVAYSVRQKRGEIGLRMALGAQRRDVLRFVLKQGLTLTAVGLGIGFVLSLAGSRVLSSLLFEVSASDPVTFVGVPLVLGVVALAACYISARRATKVDPMIALRYE
ncbi:MAG: FtsX-like permease family protein, partial [Phycisphaerae bacterium]